MGHYLVTGTAGFIGARVTSLLLAEGHSVTGLDNLNDAYDVRVKQWRLAQIQGDPNFLFVQLDLINRAGVEALFDDAASRLATDTSGSVRPFDAVINVAARAGCATRCKIPGSISRPTSPAH